MSSPLARFWNLRRSHDKSDRLIFWLVTLGTLVLVVVPTTLQGIFITFYLGVSLLLIVVPMVWGLFHRKAVWSAASAARNWAGGLGVFATLIIYSTAQQRTNAGSLELISFGIFLGVVFTILFTVLFLFQLIGASIGVLAGTGDPEPEASAGRGTHAWGLGMLFLFFLPGFQSPEDYEGIRQWMKYSVPVATLTLCLLSRTPELSPRKLLMRGVRWLDSQMIFRWDGARSVHFFDLRGGALGLFAALVALLMATTGIFTPLQLQSLGPLIQLENSNLVFQQTIVPEEEPGKQPPMVLVEMDPAIRSTALRQESETAIQARMIHRLTELGARAIVLPMPLLDPAWLLKVPERSGFDAPTPSREDIQRSFQDLPMLTEAMKQSGRVILAMHPLDDGDPINNSWKPLAEASAGQGQTRLSSLEYGWLATIPSQWSRGSIPLPYLIAEVLQPGRWLSRELEEGSQPLLINYIGLQPGEDFPRTTYSSLLNGTNSLYVVPSSLGRQNRLEHQRDSWLPEPDYFHDKVVFLDSIAWRDRQTPIGTMSMSTLQAHATNSLLHGSFIQRSSLAMDIVSALMFGMLAGHLCLRRDPFRASWRVGLATFLFGLLVVLMFLTRLIWIDPVVPVAGGILAFMLVTQFTFSLEHVELKRNRSLLQRFVAPSVVEELLRDPDRTLGLGGSRQKICVLFADVRNFTPFAEQHTPEEVIDVINAYMTALTEALHSYGGLLDKYTGDGLMALFRITEDPPEQQITDSVLAALAMRDATRMVSHRFEEEGLTPLHVGISMHYGEAVVGLVGNPNQFNYTALGHTVVVAARLNSVANQDEVIVSDAIAEKIITSFSIEERQPMMVKGLSRPVKPYLILNVRQPELAGKF